MSQETADIGNKIKNGAFWIYLQGGMGTFLQFIGGIILARILNPKDFGIFFAVSAFTVLIGKQVNFGMPAALLQAKNIENYQWNSAFWFMEVIAGLCTILVFIISDEFAVIYEDYRYSNIMKLYCINFYIMPYMLINGSMLRRKMLYKSVSQILITSSLCGIIISIFLALYGWGPYSLLISGICSSIISTILMIRISPWHPTLTKSLKGLKPLILYGWRLHLNNSLNLFSNRIDNMLIGKISGINGLGIYNRAYNLSRMPVTEITSRLYQLFFTGLSRIQNDIKYSILMFKKILCAMTTSVYPFLIVLVLQGDNIIEFLYGEKWVAASYPIRIMAVGSFALVIATTKGSLADAQNLVAKETPIQITNIIVTIIAVFAGMPWGLIGISIGIAIKSFIIMLMHQRMMAKSHVNLKLIHIGSAVWPAAFASITSGMIGTAVDYLICFHHKNLSNFLSICVVSISVIIIYGLTIYLISIFFPNNEILSWYIKLIIENSRNILKKINSAKRNIFTKNRERIVST